MPIHINSQFDSGNIEVINVHSNPIELAIRHDNQSDFYQWFHFSVTGAKDHHELKLNITNAGAAAFPDGWQHFQVVASYDREEWFRVPTKYEDGGLIFSHAPEHDLVWYSYFTPYSWERHQDLIGWAQTSDVCTLTTLGNTLDGRPLSLLTIGDDSPVATSLFNAFP